MSVTSHFPTVKRRFLPRLATIAVLLAAGIVAGPAAGSIRLLRPSPAHEMDLILGSKSSRYYRLESNQPAVVSAEGPATLKFIVRAIPPRPAPATIPYKIVVTEDRHTLKEAQTETAPSTNAWRNSSDASSQSRSLELRVPDGVHEYRVRFESPVAGAAAVRYVLRPSKRAGVQSPLYPAAHQEAVTVLVKEKPLDYFLASSRNPVTVRVIGPTTLRVVSRLVYRGRDKGRQLYTLQTERDGKDTLTQTLQTEKSLVAECVQHADWNLGRSRTVTMPVPKGVHEYSFRLSGDYAPSVALRFSIPEEDIHNGD